MHGTVEHVERLTPHLVRVVLGGEGLADLEPHPAADAYVNLAFAPPGAPYEMPCDLDAVRDEVAPAHRPVRRRYTVRRFDPAARRLTIDFVVHGDAAHDGVRDAAPDGADDGAARDGVQPGSGVACAWALAARPGDVLQLTGPGGGYSPDPTADWHLMVGDTSALPAVAAALERVPAGVPAVAVLQVPGPEDEVGLACPGELTVHWLHGPPEVDADLLPAAVRALAFPAGRVHAFVHGEAGDVRAVRRHLLLERGVAKESLSASGYWRRAMTDEAWRAVKREWQAAEASEA